MKLVVKRLLFGAAVFALLLVAAFCFRAPLLRSAADAWIVNEPLAKADAAVILGGGLQTRPFEAARLFRTGAVSRVLVMRVKPSPTTEIGLTPTEQELTSKVLLQQGVPAGNLVLVGTNVASTRDESVAVRDWVKQTKAQHIIIPTDLFHTRRVQWLFRKALAGTGARVSVVAVPQREYSAQDWWRHEEGLIAFQNELIKYAFYWVRY